jgi:hypothetical protein
VERSCLRTRALWLVLPVAMAGCSQAIRLPVEDMTLAFSVRTAIVNDREVGAAPIEVEARDGVVTLDGHVATSGERDRIVSLARSVAGVKRVESRITLGTAAVADGAAPPAPAGRRSALPPADPWPLGRYFAVGGTIEAPRMRSDGLDGLWSFGPAFRFGRGAGLKPALTLTSLRADLPPSPGTSAFGDLRLTVVGIGVAYAITGERWSLTPSLTAGYSFNHIRLDPGFAVPPDTSLPVAASGSFALTPGVTLWREVSPRVSLGFKAGYLLTRPNASWLEGDRFIRRRLTADALVVGLSAAYWVF